MIKKKPKDKYIHLRVDEDEFYEITKKAATNRQSKSDYARNVLLRYYPQAQDLLDEYKSLLDGFQKLLQEQNK